MYICVVSSLVFKISCLKTELSISNSARRRITLTKNTVYNSIGSVKRMFVAFCLPCKTGYTGYPGYPGYPGEFLGNLGDFLTFSLRVTALTKIYNNFYCVQRNSEV